MVEVTDRFVLPLADEYVFLAPSGDVLQYMGVSDLTVTVGQEVLSLYTFVYLESGTVHQIEIDKFLNIIYLDGVLQVEPYEVVSYSFSEKKFAILLATVDEESKFKHNPSLFLSPSLTLETVNSDTYAKAEEFYKERFLGAINLRVTRNQDGLLTVDACVVNKGVDPDWS